jgi:hypothetical protein
MASDVTQAQAFVINIFEKEKNHEEKIIPGTGAGALHRAGIRVVCCRYGR